MRRICKVLRTKQMTGITGFVKAGVVPTLSSGCPFWD